MNLTFTRKASCDRLPLCQWDSPPYLPPCVPYLSMGTFSHSSFLFNSLCECASCLFCTFIPRLLKSKIPFSHLTPACGFILTQGRRVEFITLHSSHPKRNSFKKQVKRVCKLHIAINTTVHLVKCKPSCFASLHLFFR